MEFNEEKNEQDNSEDFQSGTMKQWLQDNLRIIISVLIVVVIAGGIYSYSKRSEAPTQQPEDQSSILEKIAGTEDNKTGDNAAVVGEEKKEEKTETSKAVTSKENGISSVSTSQETENSFIETAARGDSQTKLARRALANYLEKNPDSALTPEHKIYIEDYLRKHSANKGRVFVGTSVEFSKSSIQEAISSAKNLNDRQLKNLHKYAVRVPSLS